MKVLYIEINQLRGVQSITVKHLRGGTVVAPKLLPSGNQGIWTFTRSLRENLQRLKISCLVSAVRDVFQYES